MSNKTLALTCVIGFLIGWSISDYNRIKSLKSEIHTQQPKIDRLQLQLDLTIASNQECRSILGEIIGEFKIEPLPIYIED